MQIDLKHPKAPVGFFKELSLVTWQTVVGFPHLASRGYYKLKVKVSGNFLIAQQPTSNQRSAIKCY